LFFFRLGPTAEEIEAAQKRVEAEIRAAEIAEKLRKEREILECKRQREEKMLEWVCNFFQYLKVRLMSMQLNVNYYVNLFCINIYIGKKIFN